MPAKPLLIVAANQHATRFFLRARTGARLDELLDHADCADFREMHGERLGRLHTYKGRTMVKSQALCADEEMEVFLRRVASEIDAAFLDYDSAGLALVAPPRVLSMLRDFISPASRARLVLEVCKDVVQARLSDIEAAAA